MNKTDVLTLLETKNFEDLSPDELAVVLNAMSESEYRTQRELIQSAHILSKKEKAALIPNPRILMMAQNKMSKKKAGAFVIFQHKVPTWAAVAACVSLFFGIRYLYHSEPEQAETTVVTETIHDTIYQEKIVTEQLPGETIIQYVYINQPEAIYETADHSNMYINEDPSFEHLTFREDPYCNIMSCYEPKKGLNAANDTLLKMAQISL